MIKQITPDIRYIGVDDLDLDLFEGQYVIPEGMAYNSYLILDRKVAVMDTVDARKGEEWLSQLEEALDGRKPDYLVAHHMDPDHSGTILELAKRYPEMKIVASAKALRAVRLMRSHSRQGAIIGIFGATDLIASSNRTWSLPLPVQPCAIASAPSSSAIFASISAISGRANEVPRRYSSYFAPACMVGMI